MASRFTVRGLILASAALPGVAAAQATDQPAASASPPQATAATSGGALEEIVVTAQKRSENLQRVPIAITAVSGGDLANQGIRTTAELATVAPGLNIRTTSSAFQPTIRGIGTSATFAENPTSLYIDGVYVPQQVGALRDLNDIAQVAVLKGPQGTLFGRNSTAGVIQITTRAPSHDPHFEIGGEIDNYETLRADVYATGGLTSTIAASLSAQYGRQSLGWGRNLTTGEDAGYLDRSYAVRGKLLFEPTPNTSVTLIGEHFATRNIGNAWQAYKNLPFTYPGYAPTGSRYDTYTDPNNLLSVRGSSASVNISQDLNFAKLVSISAMRYVNGVNRVDVDATAGQRFSIFLPDQPSRDYTQELQLVSPGGGRLTWVVGAFYIHNYVSARPLNFSLAPPFLPLAGTVARDSKETTESISGFGQATWEFLDDTRLTLGARYTHEKRAFVATETVRLGPLPARVTPVDSQIKANKPTFRVSLDRQFTPAVLGYVSFNTGFKSGGYNLFSPTNPPYRPETVKAYEAGVKSELFGRRARVNVSAFYDDYTNIQVTQVVNNTQIVSNGAKAKIYGIDADLQLSLARGLALSGGLEALHAQFTRFDNAQIATPNPAGGAVLTSGSVAGNRLPLSQKLTVNGALDYDTQLARANVHFNATATYEGDYYFEPDNFIHQPAYVTINSSVKVTPPGDHLSVMIWGKNLANNAVISFGSSTVNGFTAQYYTPPRTYGVTVRYRL